MTEVILACVVMVMTYQGFVLVVFKWNMDDVDTCEELHNTAWWIFVFSFFLFVLYAFMFSCLGFCAAIAMASGREGVAALNGEDGGSAEQYAKMEDEKAPAETA